MATESKAPPAEPEAPTVTRMVIGGESAVVGNPTVAGATVAGEVVRQGRGEKVVAFKKRRRQNSRRKRGHRQAFTVLRITEILTDGRKPSRQPQTAAAGTGGEETAGNNA